MGLASINTGYYPRGKKNLITDVKGVTVGHTTLSDGGIQTGVTAILPHKGDLFHEKLICANYVINGFGKSCGLVQIDELGTLESPIILTNTLSVGTALSACFKYMLERNSDIGGRTGTVNCVIGECNDSYLNDIRAMKVGEADVQRALETSSEHFEEGSVGAGRGMVCMGLKGGIGSSSRTVEIGEKDYTIGILVLTNFGEARRLTIDGKKIGEEILPLLKEKKSSFRREDKGSVIIVLATDLPLTQRQLKRLAKRTSLSLARTGSYCGNGSGDIAIAFSTANKIPHESSEAVLTIETLHDSKLDEVFPAVVECTEEAILSSLAHAETVTGYRGHTAFALREFYTLV